MPQVLIVGEVARRLGVKPWQVRRVVERGLVPEPTRIGAYRAFAESDLPALDAALRQAGYLADLEAVAT